MSRYDVAIIGSGLGGLSAAVMLAREGLKVLVVEQQAVAGGSLQAFRRGGRLLDTGIHYVGALDAGCTLNHYFRYLGILDRLRLQRLDDAGYDVIHLADGSTYRHAAGFDRFVDTLCEAFPDERKGLTEVVRQIEQVGSLISPEVLRSGRLSAGGGDYMALSAVEEVERRIQTPTLRQVLFGSVPLYGGRRESASFYAHAMINHSNMQGCYSFVGGGQQLVDALVDSLKKEGGALRTSARVTKLHVEGDRVAWIELNGEERLEARQVISTIHPQQTFGMLDDRTALRKAFFTRLQSLENSYGFFTVYLLFKPQTVRYEPRNHYLYFADDVWSMEHPIEGVNLPMMLLSMQPTESAYCEVASLLIPMRKGDMEPWRATQTGRRGGEYEAFKARYAEVAVRLLGERFPHLSNNIERIYTASPLTYRDYTGTPDGSAYGIVKDYRNPIVNHLPSRTRLQNLLLAGQNLNLHGVLGVVVSSAVACSELLGEEYLAKKIGDA